MKPLRNVLYGLPGGPLIPGSPPEVLTLDREEGAIKNITREQLLAADVILTNFHSLGTGEDQQAVAQSAAARDEEKFLFGAPGCLRRISATLEFRGIGLQQILETECAQRRVVKLQKHFLLALPSWAERLQNDAHLRWFVKALLHAPSNIVPAVKMPKPNLLVGHA